MEQDDKFDILIIWRGKHLKIEINSNSDLKELGLKLLQLTKVKPETMKLLIPLSTNKGSKLVSVFSAEHSSLSLQESGILEGKSIRMMGVSEDEILEVSQNNAKTDMRIIGFDEEERRLRQRSLDRLQTSLKLPQGPYVFCDFRTLHISGIKLNPPASEALRRMHMLACDPGIIAIMNKHHWRVGIMTEMAPVGYVGISPKCLLGFNKNHGEEISLRLRTDDLKGFRKYESIKKTLLHELAHMVHSEHDADFYALDKQLNQEAISLDWTKSKAYTLSNKETSFFEEELRDYSSNENAGVRLGGLASKSLDSARHSSVAAAYTRYLSASNHSIEESQNTIKDGATRTSLELEDYIKDSVEPDPDESLIVNDIDMQTDCPTDEPDPDETLDYERMCEPDPDDSFDGMMNSIKEPDPDNSVNFIASQSCKEPDPDDSLSVEEMQPCREPDPDASLGGSMPPFKEVELCHCVPERINRGIANEVDTGSVVFVNVKNGRQTHEEPDPDNSESGENTLGSRGKSKPIPSVSQEAIMLTLEPDPDDSMDTFHRKELLAIEEPVAIICSRLQKAIKMLRSEVPPAEATTSIQTLFKIIRNVIEHPNEVKFRKLRKGNPLFQRNVANYKAAMDVLAVVGFCEDIIADEVGRSETYLVLKRNDPGLLWLAKSSLEVSIV